MKCTHQHCWYFKLINLILLYKSKDLYYLHPQNWIKFKIVIKFKICDHNIQFSETVITIQFYHFLHWAVITFNFTLHLWIEDALVVSFTTLLLEQHSMQSAEANEGCSTSPKKYYSPLINDFDTHTKKVFAKNGLTVVSQDCS